MAVQPWKIAQTPEEAGISSKGLLRYLDAVEAFGIEHHSILVIRNGMLACKMNFAPYDDHTPHVLFSLSKSFCSAAAGFTVQEGLLSWDSRVAEVLSDKMPPQPSEWLKQVTLHHLLTMGSGLDPQSDMVGGEDWMKAVLACDCDAEPGTRFHYNSHGTYLVSAMVQRVTGMTIRDYLMPRLFEPLGIAKPEWDTCTLGVCVGGWGLHLSSDSIARFGLCVLQKGVWQGKQVLPVEWLEKAVSKQIENAAKEPDLTSDWQQGYGYQFWRTRGNRFRGDGMFGQVCMVSPEQNMVVAITAGLNDMALEMNLLHEYLFPAAEQEPGTEAEQQLLAKKLAELEYPWPVHDGSAFTGCYEAENKRLELSGEEATLTLTSGKRSTVCRFGMGVPKAFDVTPWFLGAPSVRCTGSAGWQNGKLTLLARTTEAPFMLRAEAIPTTDGMELSTVGVGFDTETVQLKKC